MNRFERFTNLRHVFQRNSQKDIYLPQSSDESPIQIEDTTHHIGRVDEISRLLNQASIKVARGGVACGTNTLFALNTNQTCIIVADLTTPFTLMANGPECLTSEEIRQYLEQQEKGIALHVYHEEEDVKPTVDQYFAASGLVVQHVPLREDHYRIRSVFWEPESRRLSIHPISNDEYRSIQFKQSQ